jgi:hypothetical protein
MSVIRWRSGRILLAWCAYWLALVLVFIGPGLPTLWRITRPDAKGSFSADFGDQGLKVDLVQAGQTVWSNSASGMAMLLWIALPPIILLGLVMWAQRRRRASSEEVERVIDRR